VPRRPELPAGRNVVAAKSEPTLIFSSLLFRLTRPGDPRGSNCLFSSLVVHIPVLEPIRRRFLSLISPGPPWAAISGHQSPPPTP
jgi:hypothetical protein